MYLAYKDVAKLVGEVRGNEEPNFMFCTVSDSAFALQPKGLFVPLTENDGELSHALANGAIAAIWSKGKKLPDYTPSQFPVFLTDDPLVVVRNLLQEYLEKIDGDIEKKMEITKFDFINKKLLNKNDETYDIAVMLKKAAVKNKNNQTERRG